MHHWLRILMSLSVRFYNTHVYSSMIAQLVKNPPAMQETPVQFLGQEDLQRRDKLPTSGFWGFPCGSAGKEFTHKCKRPGFYLWVGKIPRRRERLPTPVFWPGEFQMGHKESDTTEQLSLSPVTDYFGGAPKSLQIVTAAMKLKDACSLKEKSWST